MMAKIAVVLLLTYFAPVDRSKAEEIEHIVVLIQNHLPPQCLSTLKRSTFLKAFKFILL